MSFSGDMTGPIVPLHPASGKHGRFAHFFSVGLIRKLKARMQNRIERSAAAALFMILPKLATRDQTVSATTTTVFLLSSAINVSAMILIAILVPWVSFKPSFPGDDLFLLLYLLALCDL